MQKFNERVRSFELKRNLDLMYAQEKYVEEPPTVEALRFTVQQDLSMRGSARTDHYLAVPQQQAPPQNELNQAQQKTDPPLIPSAQQAPPAPVAFRQQPPRVCFNCGDRPYFEADCPVKDRAR